MDSITHATSGTTGTSKKTFRSACITEHKKIPEWDQISAKIRYLAYAEETCPTTKKKHYQAFAYAHDKMKLTGWKKLFPTAHIEEMLGSFNDNEKYCSKEGMLTELGVRASQHCSHRRDARAQRLPVPRRHRQRAPAHLQARRRASRRASSICLARVALPPLLAGADEGQHPQLCATVC